MKKPWDCSLGCTRFVSDSFFGVRYIGPQVRSVEKFRCTPTVASVGTGMEQGRRKGAALAEAWRYGCRQGVLWVMTRPADHVRSFSKYRGSSGVWSRGVWNLTGQVGSGQEVFKSCGSGRVALTRPEPCKTLGLSLKKRGRSGLPGMQRLESNDRRTTSTRARKKRYRTAGVVPLKSTATFIPNYCQVVCPHERSFELISDSQKTSYPNFE